MRGIVKSIKLSTMQVHLYKSLEHYCITLDILLQKRKQTCTVYETEKSTKR